MSELAWVVLATLFGCAVIMAFSSYGLVKGVSAFYARRLNEYELRIAELESQVKFLWQINMAKHSDSTPPPPPHGININVGDATYGEVVHGNKSTDLPAAHP